MKIVFPEFTNPNIQQAIVESAIDALPADSLQAACEMLRQGIADAMIVGIDHSTRDVILAARDHLGATSPTFSASCYFEKPATAPENPATAPRNPATHQATPFSAPILLADTAACKHPTEAQLYDICVQTHATATHLFETPRLALLSFSTHGSGGHDDTMTATQNVVQRLHAERPDILVDGEMQLDAALDSRVAAKKCPGSPTAGQANVLICPDLNTGNILYKSLEYFAGYHAAGPILQGFAKPISDLSRGSTVEDIKLTIATITKICTNNATERHNS